MQFPLTRALLLCLLGWSISCAAQVEVNVTGATGAPLKDALVMVQDLAQNHERELFRVLTDERGNIPPRSLTPGLYRAIATYPYGHFQTSVREFLVGSDAMSLKMQMTATENSASTTVSIGQLTVHVVDSKGSPAAGARVLIRDADATPDSEHWGTTNAQGNATLELTIDPSVLVVVYRDRLFTFPADAFTPERTLRLP